MPVLKYWDGAAWQKLLSPVVEPPTVLSLRMTTTKTGLANAVWTVVSGWSVETSYPTWAAESAGSFTIPSSGYYRIEFIWTSNRADLFSGAGISISGTLVRQSNWNQGPVAGHQPNPVWWEGNLNAGDTVALMYYINNAAVNILSGAGNDGYPAGNYLTKAVIRKIVPGGIPSEVPTVLNLAKSGTQAIAGAADVKVTGWTVIHSYPGWAPENAGEFAVPSDGYYRVDFEGMFLNSPGGTIRATTIFVNGLKVVQTNQYHNTANQLSGACWWEGNLKAGDKVAAYVYSQDAATLLDAYSSTALITRLVIRKIISGGIPAGGGSPDTGWTPLTLINGWTNYAGFETAAYRRINGVVYLRGLIQNGSIAACATLPVGFRPSASKLMSSHSNGGAARIDVASNGDVIVTAPSLNGWLTLAPVIFPADQ